MQSTGLSNKNVSFKIKCTLRDSLHWHWWKTTFFYLRFQLWDIILPDIREATLLSFASVSQWLFLFLHPLPIWCLCPACRSVGATGKPLISRKLASKNTENSFNLWINMKVRTNGKSHKFFFTLHLHLTEVWLLTGWRAGENWSRMTVWASPMTQKPL